MLPIVGIVMFTAAGLVFAVEPLMSKLLLPLFGGSAMVWAASLVFFQAGLLLGYTYAFASSRWLTLRRQVTLHVAVVLLPMLALPLTVRAGDLVSGTAPPTAVFGILALSAGLPYIALASTSPILQHWFSTTTHPTASDPYFLYAAGNAGSLLGLVAYPFAFEPVMALSAQRWLWSATYVAFVALMIPAGWLVLRRQRATATVGIEVGVVHAYNVTTRTQPTTDEELTEPATGGLHSRQSDLPGATRRDRTAAPTAPRYARWVLLAFVPSAMLTAVTTFVTADIAAVPLLWVVPLALYLVAFIVAYGRRRIIPARAAGTALAVLAAAVVLTVLGAVDLPLLGMLALQYGMFFSAALVAATLLADDRPGTDHLTIYYLLIALGGVLGGSFSGLVAPILFNSTLEYAISLLMAIALIPPLRPARPGLPGPLRDILIGLLLFAGLIGLLTVLASLGVGAHGLVLTLAVSTVSALALRGRPVRLAFALGGVFAVTTLLAQTPLHSERTFYGIHRVVDEGDRHVYISGSTIHGAEVKTAGGGRRPLTYYHPDGPVGDVFAMSGPPQSDRQHRGSGTRGRRTRGLRGTWRSMALL